MNQQNCLKCEIETRAFDSVFIRAVSDATTQQWTELKDVFINYKLHRNFNKCEKN